MEIRTGYFAYAKKYTELGYKCVSIARVKPKWFDGVSLYELAPPINLLERYKRGIVSEEVFKEEYLFYLKSIDIESIFNGLSTDDKLVLLCYEKTNSFCHRHILAEYLNKKYDLYINELIV